MKPKTLISLAAIVCILGLTAFFLTREKTPQPGAAQMGDLFLPKLPVNEIASIVIASDQGAVHLSKSQTVWQVAERNGYPADFGKITDMVRKLSRLKIGRTFQASEDALARQKLNDPSDAKTAEDQKGLRITLTDKQNKVLADLILGNLRETPTGAGGQYIRPSDSKTVSLVDDNFQYLGKRPQDWLKRDVVNLDQKSIVQVSAFDPKATAPVFVIRREDPNQKPVLLNPPAGKTVDSQKVEQLFDAMSPLKIEDVSGPLEENAQQQAGPAASRPRLEYRLNDGKIFTVFPFVEKANDSQPEIHRVQVVVAYEPVSSPPAAPAKQAAAADKPSEDKKAPEAPKPEQIAKQAQELNGQLHPWNFALAKWQFDSFITQLDGLLQKTQTKPQKP